MSCVFAKKQSGLFLLKDIIEDSLASFTLLEKVWKSYFTEENDINHMFAQENVCCDLYFEH